MRDTILRFIESGQAEALDAHQLLTWALKTFAPKIALSCSFGAPEGLVLLDMLHRIDPASRVFVLDTGRLPQATYDLIDRVRDRYDKRIEVVFPEASAIQAMVQAKGMNLFYESIENRQLCCRLRKVEPLARHLSGLDAWVTGLRRDQGVTREDTAKVQIDTQHGGIVKVNPIADWTHEQVLAYVRKHNVPDQPAARRGLPVRGLRPVLARHRGGRRSARRPLVVGEPRDTRVRHPRRRAGEGVRHLIDRRTLLEALVGLALAPGALARAQTPAARSRARSGARATRSRRAPTSTSVPLLRGRRREHLSRRSVVRVDRRRGRGDHGGHDAGRRAASRAASRACASGWETTGAGSS